MSNKHFSFEGPLKLFPQKGGWYYVLAPLEISEPLIHLADRGLIAIEATVGISTWLTSLLPMGDGTHFIAMPAKVRQKEKLLLGNNVQVSFMTRTR